MGAHQGGMNCTWNPGQNRPAASPRRTPYYLCSPDYFLLQSRFLPQSRSKTAAFDQKTQAAVRMAMDSPQEERFLNQVG
jgi:hypothetical protein